MASTKQTKILPADKRDNNEPSKELRTFRESAQRLAMAEKTLRDWARQRMIAAVYLSPRAVRIPQSEIDRIIEAGYRPALPRPMPPRFHRRTTAKKAFKAQRKATADTAAAAL